MRCRVVSVQEQDSFDIAGIPGQDPAEQLRRNPDNIPVDQVQAVPLQNGEMENRSRVTIII